MRFVQSALLITLEVKQQSPNVTIGDSDYLIPCRTPPSVEKNKKKGKTVVRNLFCLLIRTSKVKFRSCPYGHKNVSITQLHSQNKLYYFISVNPQDPVFETLK
jgi:hypothetical protein